MPLICKFLYALRTSIQKYVQNCTCERINLCTKNCGSVSPTIQPFIPLNEMQVDDWRGERGRERAQSGAGRGEGGSAARFQRRRRPFAISSLPRRLTQSLSLRRFARSSIRVRTVPAFLTPPYANIGEGKTSVWLVLNFRHASDPINQSRRKRQFDSWQANAPTDRKLQKQEGVSDGTSALQFVCLDEGKIPSFPVTNRPIDPLSPGR